MLLSYCFPGSFTNEVSPITSTPKNPVINRRIILTEPDKPSKPTIKQRLTKLLGPEISEQKLHQMYTFIKELGNGATAKVYLAKDHKTQQLVAIKCIHKASLIRPRALVRRSKSNTTSMETASERAGKRLLKIINEIEISQKMNHPNIVKYIRGHETTHRICLVLEYTEGIDLLEYILENGRMNEEGCIAVCTKILEALKCCHQHNIYHRDLKLENVLVTKDLDVKLIDFGLSEQTGSRGRVHSVCGTPLYCSPEILLSSPTTRACGFDGQSIDIWSVGIIIYAMLSRCSPFDDTTLTSLRKDLMQLRIHYPDYFSESSKNILRFIFQRESVLRPSANELLQHAWICGQKMQKEGHREDSSSDETDTSSIDFEV